MTKTIILDEMTLETDGILLAASKINGDEIIINSPVLVNREKASKISGIFNTVNPPSQFITFDTKRLAEIVSRANGSFVSIGFATDENNRSLFVLSTLDTCYLLMPMSDSRDCFNPWALLSRMPNKRINAELTTTANGENTEQTNSL